MTKTCDLKIRDNKSGRTYRVIAGSFSEDAQMISRTGNQTVTIEGKLVNSNTISAQTWTKAQNPSN